MHERLMVEQYIYDVVNELQQSGYETYIVGGAIRDLLQHREPKDYDISTAATPEQVQQVFGRRRARIIGKRFKLVHLVCRKEILEISTFRSAPSASKQAPLTPGAKRIAELDAAEHLIFNDNDYGTAEEDAWRRDFTVNALFYDPVSGELLDYTGQGISDIENGIVRAIGNPRLRFEEDPVRILRALKLIGQYHFQLERKTESDLQSSLPLIQLSPIARLSLELEKIMKSAYSADIFRAFHEYGFLEYFMPWLGSRCKSAEFEMALKLLEVRDRRVRAGYYRNSMSLAMATLALPFVNSFMHAAEQREAAVPEPESGEEAESAEELMRQIFLTVYSPLAVIKRLSFSACRILMLQPWFLQAHNLSRLVRQRSFSHAFELIKIRHEAGLFECDDAFVARFRELARSGVTGQARSTGEWEEFADSPGDSAERKKRKSRRGGARKRKKDSEKSDE